MESSEVQTGFLSQLFLIPEHDKQMRQFLTFFASRDTWIQKRLVNQKKVPKYLQVSTSFSLTEGRCTRWRACRSGWQMRFWFFPGNQLVGETSCRRDSCSGLSRRFSISSSGSSGLEGRLKFAVDLSQSLGWNVSLASRFWEKTLVEILGTVNTEKNVMNFPGRKFVSWQSD